MGCLLLNSSKQIVLGDSCTLHDNKFLVAAVRPGPNEYSLKGQNSPSPWFSLAETKAGNNILVAAKQWLLGAGNDRFAKWSAEGVEEFSRCGGQAKSPSAMLPTWHHSGDITQWCSCKIGYKNRMTLCDVPTLMTSLLYDVVLLCHCWWWGSPPLVRDGQEPVKSMDPLSSPGDWEPRAIIA